MRLSQDTQWLGTSWKSIHRILGYSSQDMLWQGTPLQKYPQNPGILKQHRIISGYTVAGDPLGKVSSDPGQDIQWWGTPWVKYPHTLTT